MKAAAGYAGNAGSALSCGQVQTSALIETGGGAFGLRTIALARCQQTEYSPYVPDKEGNGFDSSTTQKRTDRALRFFYVRMPSCALYERRWRGSRKARWLSFVCRSVNPVICRSPRLTAGRGLPHTKDALMAIDTRTPKQPQQFTLNPDEVRFLLAYRNMDDRHRNECLIIAEGCAVDNPRVRKSVLRLVVGGVK